ncbi:hypothetical protein [Arthrobacter sp. Soil762]|uniref:hypothetical protein n=1 Tax=Arthrobacter sp. Soil762 TaxID=1736401 RepID=UPI0006FD3ED6|nr:hypothetical protein [Arthrobacter sp. Soil762]KRE70488.1 hypothetical protein ASG77_14220 [Arthrobacter sp. Soil762]
MFPAAVAIVDVPGGPGWRGDADAVVHHHFARLERHPVAYDVLAPGSAAFPLPSHVDPKVFL